MRIFNIALIAGAAFLGVACDDPLDVNPRSSMPSEGALNTAEAMEIAITGMYDALQQGDGAYARDAIVYPDLYAETLDFTGTYQTDREVDQHTVTASNVAIADIWGDFYDAVNRANVVLGAISDIEGVSDAQRNVWEGEARFVRALSYFNLVRLFGGVPLVTDPTLALEGDYQPERATVDAVYGQIITDLTEAIELLPPERSSFQASGYAAAALLAKAYLEQGRCGEALPLLNDIIDNGPFTLLDDYRDVFTVANNAELIFAIDFSVNDSNAMAFWFYAEDYGGRWGFAPSAELIDAYESLDSERAVASVAFDSDGNPFGIKYNRISAGDDDVTVLRLADVYLMRAEANLCENATAETVLADINEVRERADVPLLNADDFTTDEELRDALLHERFVELAMEGHRFFDLRRLGVAEEVLNIDASQLVFPIPQRERDVNPNLEQNTGY